MYCRGWDGLDCDDLCCDCLGCRVSRTGRSLLSGRAVRSGRIVRSGLSVGRGWLADRFRIGRPYLSISGFPSLPTRKSPGLSRGSLECGVVDMGYILNGYTTSHSI